MATTLERIRSSADYEAKRKQYAENAKRIGWVLRVGVSLSSLLVGIGLILFLTGHGGPDTRDAALGKGVDLQPLSVSHLYHRVIKADSEAIIELGLIVLLLTPMARVALTLALFIRQRDRIYIALSTIVLVILLLGFFGIGE
jgi:uncharacterized membrane protein